MKVSFNRGGINYTLVTIPEGRRDAEERLKTQSEAIKPEVEEVSWRKTNARAKKTRGLG